jgi:hypothetical protein
VILIGNEVVDSTAFLGTYFHSLGDKKIYLYYAVESKMVMLYFGDHRIFHSAPVGLL